MGYLLMAFPKKKLNIQNLEYAILSIDTKRVICGLYGVTLLRAGLHYGP